MSGFSQATGMGGIDLSDWTDEEIVRLRELCNSMLKRRQKVADDVIIYGSLSVGDTVCRRPSGRSCKVTIITDYGACIRDGSWHGVVKWSTLKKKWRK